MKVLKLAGYVALSLVLSTLINGPSYAFSTLPILKVDNSLLDPSLLPATADQIQDDLRRSPNNGLELVACADLRKLVQAYPDNPNLLAAYCLSYGVASGYYRVNWHHRAFGLVDLPVKGPTVEKFKVGLSLRSSCGLCNCRVHAARKFI
jgi:hypothetical protein